MATTRHELSPPSLEELARTLSKELQKTYAIASATVEQCPDLRQAPFGLASAGLGGDEVIADIGGQGHLFPRPLFEKKYSLPDCARKMDMSPDQGQLLGAGAAPFHVLGYNAELAPNLSWRDGFENVTNLTRFAAILPENELTTSSRPPSGENQDAATKSICRLCPSTDCALMMNLFGSRGERGDVLKIAARARRTKREEGNDDGKGFAEILRQALNRVYGDERQISLGGVFVIKTGTAMFHVMPDFPPRDKLPFPDRQAVSDWLTFHRFQSPMVCLTVFHSADPEKLDLRMEHTHCFGLEEKVADQGGHYHYDLEAEEAGGEEIEYEAYLNSAKVLYRIDRPST